MKDLLGTWRLVATSAVDTAGGRPLPQPYGPKAMGTLTFTADRMMAVLCDGRAQVEGPREYNSYCGAYTFDGKTLVTRVDAASTAARMDTDQVRAVRFDGARLILRPPPQPYRDGGMQQRELTWERIG